MQSFIKYQSLGNDFIVFDYFDLDQISFNKIQNSKFVPNYIKDLCNRNYGIGANGILLVNQQIQGNTLIPQIFIFNSDGSKAELCLNGLRCIAHYFYKYKNFPKVFELIIHDKIVKCEIIQKDADLIIKTNIGAVHYLGEKTVDIRNTNIYTYPCLPEDLAPAQNLQNIQRTFSGHLIDAGNPHFVIFEKTTEEWLRLHGTFFENHKEFPNKINTEFVWSEQIQSNPKQFNVIVYERGCGITLSCSSGAAAIVETLYKIGKIEENEEVIFYMLGGKLNCFIDSKKNITLAAKASPIFVGKIV